MRRLLKFKYSPKAEQVFIKYETLLHTLANGEEIWETHTIESGDVPKQELKIALQAFVTSVCEIIEAPREWAEDMTVRGVTFTYRHDVRGAVITALRELDTSNAPMVVNTPHLPAEPYNEENDFEPTLPGSVLRCIDELDERVFAFVDGDRAQRELDFEEEVEESEQELTLV